MSIDLSVHVNDPLMILASCGLLGSAMQVGIRAADALCDRKFAEAAFRAFSTGVLIYLAVHVLLAA